MSTFASGPVPGSAEAKACCATAYSSDVVAMLLGESYHPGGLALTRTLTARLGLRADTPVLDIACGRGTTALAIAAEHGCPVSGVDLSEANIAAAAAAAAKTEGEFDFRVGDAEALPFDDGAFAAAVCECALCTFPDKATAAREFARILAPGGRLGITDVTADLDRLPAELAGLGGWVACVADARPLSEYARILRMAGFQILTTGPRNDAIRRMIDQIEARLQLVRMTMPERAAEIGVDFDAAPEMLRATRQAVDDGILGYGLLVAQRIDSAGRR